MLRSSTWLPLAMLALIAALTYWLKVLTEGDSPLGKEFKDNRPDLIVEKFEVRNFSPDGLIETKVQASKMEHYPLTDHALLTQVRVERSKPGEAPLIVTSPSARVDRPIEQVTLPESVVLERAAFSKNGAVRQPLKITTKDVVLDSKNGVAYTQAPVLAETPGSSVRSDGMHYTQESEVLKLTNVRALLLPKGATSQ
jgi:lipopolysaccharide export system protein LptC